MLRVLAGLMILAVALLIGALWGAAFVAESPLHASAVASIARSRQLQAAGLFVAAPLCFVASILVFARSRYAIPWCLLTGAYAVGSLLFVMRSPFALIQEDHTFAWIYAGVAAVPLLLGCVATLLRKRESPA